ncbi:alpha/beta hydrolase [Pseudomonas citronellolis]|uniref:alpha/beta hydrolase n=1 Tax=Pseudomonas citronellolis TaxID=53408 RepID=UPI0020A12A17|nr:alpha/beta hydrolase [Pseudomonas citronellolis]MCP1606074.1 acetyl esterase [Pseudomonas citronellolis]MCP1656516.1 acetyl esterase [Pseudomonas citronellolis]MCP1723545.1 acetyl esterase [Pseudomonas citronellolis]
MALDPSTQDFVTAARLNARKPRHLMSPEEARDALAGLKGLLGPGAGLALRENRRLAVAGGEIELRLLRPEGELLGVIVYFHGGGWVVGSNDEFEPMCRNLAAQSGCAIVMVCYRKAPEQPFPIPLEDAWAGFEWVAAQRRALFGSDLPLLLAGDSAGGNLAACVALRERQRGGERIRGLVLIYPVTDADFQTASYLDPDMQVLLPAEVMRYYWDHYVPDASRRSDPRVAPLRSPSVAGLPPSIILTAEHDVLRDEGEAFAARLREAGVPVAHRRFEGQIHAFMMMVDLLPGSAEAIRYTADEIRALLGGR